MKIAVLGATGATGRQVIAQALAQGDQVVAYVRDPQGIAAKPGLKVVVGPLSDAAALKAAISGTGAVLVCLGTHKMKPVDLLQKSMPLIVRAMKEVDVARLVLLSAYGVGETALTAGFLARIVYKTMVPAIYRDKELLRGAATRFGTEMDRHLSCGPDQRTADRCRRGAADGAGTEGLRSAAGLPCERSARHARRGKERPDHRSETARQQQAVCAVVVAGGETSSIWWA